MKIAFISGHVNLTAVEFEQHYQSLILQAIAAGDQFVIGSARGGDRLALEFLLKNNVNPQRITIYLYEKSSERVVELRNEFTKLGVKIFEGFKSYTLRDAEMTANSDYDIAWVRSEVECRLMYGNAYKSRVSGTQLNLERRQKSKKTL